jgi:hypothetical protein
MAVAPMRMERCGAAAPVKWAIAAWRPGTTRLVTPHPRKQETTGRLKGTVKGVPVGQGAKGPEQFREPRAVA